MPSRLPKLCRCINNRKCIIAFFISPRNLKISQEENYDINVGTKISHDGCDGAIDKVVKGSLESLLVFGSRSFIKVMPWPT